MKLAPWTALKLTTLIAFAAGSIGCGEITVPMTLALDGEDNFIDLYIPAGAPTASTIDLSGGVDTTMTLEIDLLDLILQQSVFGGISVDDLLFGGSSFSILGIDTGTICVTQDELNPGMGLAAVDIFAGQIDFNIDLGTSILLTNPVLGGLIPDGFPFVISVADTADLSLLDMLALAFGNPDGGLTVTQSFQDTIVADIGGLMLPIGVDATLTLSTASEIPVTPLVQECIDFLAVP